MECIGRDLSHNTPQRLRDQTMCIGIVGPLSGSSALLGAEMQQAAQLAIEEQNAAGGILGATVRAEAADDEGKAQKGKAVARDFCARSEILGVAGHYNSDVTSAASRVYHECGLALITPSARSRFSSVRSSRQTPWRWK